MEELLAYLKNGNDYCTDNYDIFYEHERGTIILSAKHSGHELSEEEFLSIEDIETFTYYTDGEATLYLKL